MKPVSLMIGPALLGACLGGAAQDTNTTEQNRPATAKEAPAHFVLGYHYLTQGHNDAAAKQFEHAAGLQPSDKLSAQLRRPSDRRRECLLSSEPSLHEKRYARCD